MRRIGEVFVTVAILTMVASLAVADQFRRKVCGVRHKPRTEVLDGAEIHPAETESPSRAESMILHVL